MSKSQPSFIAELQRRNVHRAALLYAGAAWLLVQVATQVFPFFDIPNGIVRAVVIAAAIGFPFAMLFSWFYEWTPQGIKRESEIDHLESITHETGKKLDRAIIAVLGFAVVLLLLNQFVLHRFMSATAKSAATSAVSDKSIAVLPFANLSADADNAYFATGMQDEILTKLSKVKALKVISRTSTLHFTSSPDNLPEIAAKLGVSAILEGSVQKIGDAVHINVQLIRAATDAHLWAESYNRKLDDVFAVQGEVAQAVAEALSASLSGSEQQQIAEKPTSNIAAYEAYLRGLAMENRYTNSASDFRKRATAYQEAVALDPNFALAWCGLANAHTELYLTTEQTAEQLAQAKQALDQAMRLAPDSSETHAARAFYLYYGRYDFDGAYAEYSKALETRPNDGHILYAMGNVRRRQGRWDEALTLQTRAAALDPLSTQTWFNLGLSFRALRRYDEAQAAFDRGLAAAPDDFELLAQKTQTLQFAGNFEAAAKIAEQLPLDSDNADIYGTRLDQWRYQHDVAREISETQQVLQRRATLTPDDVASLLLRLGAAELAAGQRDSGHAHLVESRQLAETLQRAGNQAGWLDDTISIAAALIGDCETANRAADTGAAKVDKDLLILPLAIAAQAIVRMTCGDRQQAITLIARILTMPDGHGMSPATLRVDPRWDLLRDEPRFQHLLAAPPAPRTSAPS